MLFSIIIPVYNVEKYLDECVISIINQIGCATKDYEIILVDDGSTDNSGQICDVYQSKYPEVIKVFHKVNEGLLLARRFGFSKAIGDYIINCDSDDFLEANAFFVLKNIIAKYRHPDVILFNYFAYDGTRRINSYMNVFTNENDCFVTKELVYKEFLLNHSIVSMCTKVYKRDCIDIERDYKNFSRICSGEDTLQSIEVFDNAETFTYINQALYNYRIGTGMTHKFDEKYFSSFKSVFEQIAYRKGIWKIQEFDRLFAIKVLQMTGRAITQSRYNNWRTYMEHIDYLRNINDDEMLQKSIFWINELKPHLQQNHYILLRLLNKKWFLLIVLMLRTKNIISSFRANT
jgi:glycosyltransferase involved in cell wall biosynthesis